MIFYFLKGGLKIKKSCNQRDAGPNLRPKLEIKTNSLHTSGAKAFRSCKYCGKIHDESYICDKRPIKRKKIDDIVRFRNSPSWRGKRREIKDRDNYLCQICIRELYGTTRKYNYKGLQVHHAIQINSSVELKLDDSNLITLCSMHHAMCDKGMIPCDEVMKIISEQETKNLIK